IGFLKPKKPKWNILISDLDAPTTRAGALVFIVALFIKYLLSLVSFEAYIIFCKIPSHPN
ncbi:hypothetical protein ACF1CY_004814, partial [Providencia rettgeri]